VRLTGSRPWMGPFANRPATAATAWVLVAGLSAVNFFLLARVFS